MAYNSAHTGPEIDAAVEMLGQVQDARDATSGDRSAVVTLASQVAANASQVASQAATVSAKTGQVLASATAVEQAHTEVLSASTAAVDAKDATVLYAESAQASQDSAAASAFASSQSQLAAGLSEQVSAENAASTSADRLVVDELVQQVAADSASAAVNAQNAAAVVTGGTATFAPASGKIPLANAQGKIDSEWLGADVARSDAVQATADLANDGLAAIAELKDGADPTKGAALIPWDGESVSEQIDLSRKMQDYAELRAYLGSARRVYITQNRIEGPFILDFSDDSSVDDGGTVIVGQGSRRWKRQFVGAPNVKWYEDSAHENDPASVQKAINASRSLGATCIEVDTEINVPIALADRSRVTFRGDGKLTGEGAYRKQVFPWNAQSAQPTFADLDPAKHLQRFSSTKSPSVVLVGSSTGAWQPNSIDTSSTVARLLSERIARYNKDKTVKFFNRCIGGQSYPHLDSVPTSFPAWYADHAKPWIDYVKDLAPDVVFLIMGSGDSSDMLYSHLKSVTDKLKAFTKTPDIVYITQPSVNPDPHANYSTFGTRAGQEGRDYAAGIIRSFALFNNYGFIDANRVGGIVLDGRDLVDTISERIYTSVPLSGGYTSDVKSHDYSMRLRFTGDLAAIDAAFTAAGNPNNPVFFRTGPGDKGDGRGGDIVYIKKSPTGFFQFDFFVRGELAEANYASVTTSVPFPTASFVLDIFKCGCTVGVSVGGSEDSAFMMFPIIAGGGEFSAQVGGRVSGGPFPWMDYLNVGRPKQYLPSLTSQQAWGENSADATTQLPWGGNGANHFSSLGTTFIYGPLLNRAVLTASKIGEGAYTPAIGAVTNSTLPAASLAMWMRVGDTVTVSGMVSVTPQTSGLVQVDIALPIPSNLLVPADVAGTCGVGGVSGMNGSVWGNDAADMARIQLTTSVLVAQNVRYTYTYRIR